MRIEHFRTVPRVFTEPKNPILTRVLNSRSPTVEQVLQGLERNAAPLVKRFAKRLKSQEGLRDDILVR